MHRFCKGPSIVSSLYSASFSFYSWLILGPSPRLLTAGLSSCMIPPQIMVYSFLLTFFYLLPRELRSYLIFELKIFEVIPWLALLSDLFSFSDELWSLKEALGSHYRDGLTCAMEGSVRHQGLGWVWGYHASMVWARNGSVVIDQQSGSPHRMEFQEEGDVGAIQSILATPPPFFLKNKREQGLLECEPQACFVLGKMSYLQLATLHPILFRT